VFRNILLAWIALALTLTLLQIASARPLIVEARAPQIHHRFFMAHGYLHDSHPDRDATLLVWSKTHKLTYQIAVTGSTVFKFHTTVIPRSHLAYNAYVIVSCTGTAPDHLTAVVVHLEVPRKRSASH
jgi:hypothetical protein